MTDREVVIVAACDLQPGDMLRQARPTTMGVATYHEATQWQVLDVPIRLAMTQDVAVRFGIRKNDPGLTLRLPAYEQVAVYRDVARAGEAKRTG